jgi:hypothetical protein
MKRQKSRRKYYFCSSRDRGNRLLTLVDGLTAPVKLFFLNRLFSELTVCVQGVFPFRDDYQSIQPALGLGSGYSIAYSQPEAHTKRFSLADDKPLSHSGYWGK